MKLRQLDIDGEPWFVAIDVVRSLGLGTDKGAYPHLRKMDPEEVVVSPNPIRGKGMYAPKLVNESGLYKLILRSDKPEAKVFQNWVTQDVLPSIKESLGIRQSDWR